MLLIGKPGEARVAFHASRIAPRPVEDEHDWIGVLIRIRARYVETIHAGMVAVGGGWIDSDRYIATGAWHECCRFSTASSSNRSVNRKVVWLRGSLSYHMHCVVGGRQRSIGATGERK